MQTVRSLLNDPDVRIAIAVGAIAALAYLCWTTLSMLLPGSGNKKTSKLSPYRNLVTGPILCFCIMAILSGILIVVMFENFFFGALSAMTGAAIWIAGHTEIPSDPRHAGLIRFYGSYIKIFGKYVAVGGDTILADYWPFYLGVDTVEVIVHDFELPLDVYAQADTDGSDQTSGSEISLEGKASVALRPKMDDLVTFMLAGGMKKIRKLVDDIIVREVRHVAGALKASKIVKDPVVLTDAFGDQLMHRLNRILEANSFGVEFTKLQLTFNFAKKVREAMDDQQVEYYQRNAERADNKTMYIEAEDLLAYHRKHGNNGITFEQCLNKVFDLRQVREGRTRTIETKGKKGGKVNTIEVDKI